MKQISTFFALMAEFGFRDGLLTATGIAKKRRVPAPAEPYRLERAACLDRARAGVHDGRNS